VVTVGVAVGFCRLDVKPSDPIQFHAVVLLEFELNVTVPPIQIAPLLVAPVVDGTGLTVTVVR
jgi:hypothetical protein